MLVQSGVMATGQRIGFGNSTRISTVKLAEIVSDGVRGVALPLWLFREERVHVSL